MLRSAFIATGGRAISHAKAYEGLRSMRIVAAADLDAARVKKFAEDNAVPATYTDYRKMLAEQKPDVVHLVTNPNVRVDPVRACAENGVKLVIVEKPMAVSLADAEQIEQISKSSGIKVVINTQRRYFQSWIDLCRIAHSAEAGRIHFVRIQTVAAVMCTGSHLLDMTQLLLRDVDPIAVWATAYGEEEYHSTHPGPASFLTSITYPDRIQVLYEASKESAGVVGNDEYFMATEINVGTDRGRLWWTEKQGWGYQFEGMSQPKRFPTSFMQDDGPGQTAFTEAAAAWLADPAKPHGNRLETAIRVFRIIAAMTQSATENRRIDFDPATLRDTSAELRSRIASAEGVHPEKQEWAWRPRGS